MNPEEGNLNKLPQIMMLWRVIRKLSQILPPKWECSDLITFQLCNGEKNAADKKPKKKKGERLEWVKYVEKKGVKSV
jgi:hypothetical protein